MPGPPFIVVSLFLRGGRKDEFHPPALKLEVIAVLGMRADYEEEIGKGSPVHLKPNLESPL